MQSQVQWKLGRGDGVSHKASYKRVKGQEYIHRMGGSLFTADSSGIPPAYDDREQI